MHLGQRHFAQRLGFGLLDPDQGRVAQLVDPRLDGQHRRQRQVDKLKKAGFQFPLHTDAAVSFFNLHNDGRMRQSENLGQNHARLRISVIVRLQAGEDQVKFFILDGGRDRPRRVVGIEADKSSVLEMDRPVRAFRQRLAQNLQRPRRAGRQDDHLARMLFLLPQRLFERKRVRLIHFVGNIFADPRPRFIQLQRSVFLRYLLHANQNLHGSTPMLGGVSWHRPNWQV